MRLPNKSTYVWPQLNILLLPLLRTRSALKGRFYAAEKQARPLAVYKYVKAKFGTHVRLSWVGTGRRGGGGVGTVWRRGVCLIPCLFSFFSSLFLPDKGKKKDRRKETRLILWNGNVWLVCTSTSSVPQVLVLSIHRRQRVVHWIESTSTDWTPRTMQVASTKRLTLIKSVRSCRSFSQYE